MERILKKSILDIGRGSTGRYSYGELEQLFRTSMHIYWDRRCSLRNDFKFVEALGEMSKEKSANGRSIQLKILYQLILNGNLMILELSEVWSAESAEGRSL